MPPQSPATTGVPPGSPGSSTRDVVPHDFKTLSLEDQKTWLEERDKELTKKIVEQKDRFDQSYRCLETAMRHLAECKATMEEFGEVSRLKFQKQVSTLRAEKSAMTTAHDVEVQDLKKKVSSLRAEKSAMKNAHEVVVQNLKDKIKDYATKVKECKVEIEEHKATIKECEVEIKDVSEYPIIL